MTRSRQRRTRPAQLARNLIATTVALKRLERRHAPPAFVSDDPRLERYRVTVATVASCLASRPAVQSALAEWDAVVTRATTRYLSTLDAAGRNLGRDANELLRGADLSPLPRRLHGRLLAAQAAFVAAIRRPLRPSPGRVLRDLAPDGAAVPSWLPGHLWAVNVIGRLYRARLARSHFGAIPVEASTPTTRRRRRPSRRTDESKRDLEGVDIVRRDAEWYCASVFGDDESKSRLAQNSGVVRGTVQQGIKRARRRLFFLA